MQIKRHWLGHHWYLPGSEGNDIMRVCPAWIMSSPRLTNLRLTQTNVPNSRLTYRHETLLDELENIRAGCALDSTTPVIPHKDLSGPAGTGAVMNLTDDFVGAQAMAGS
jgi:AMP deaminase